MYSYLYSISQSVHSLELESVSGSSMYLAKEEEEHEEIKKDGHK